MACLERRRSRMRRQGKKMMTEKEIGPRVFAELGVCCRAGARGSGVGMT